MQQRTAVLATAFVLITVSGFGSALAASPNPQNNPILKEIFERLDLNAQIDMNQYPIDDLVDVMSDQYRIPFAIDLVTLREAGIDYRRLLFTHTEKEVPLRKILKHFLAQHNLSFVVKNYRVLITTADAAQKWQAEFGYLND
jgi:hypothetical protein